MIKKIGSLVMGMIIFASNLVSSSVFSVPASTVESKSYDSEYVMWTDKKIDEGFYTLTPNASNKEASGIQHPYNNKGDVYDKWAYYEFLWTHGYPIGNGRMGAMVMGGLDKEVIQINEDTVWNGSPYVDSDGKSTGGSVKDSWKYYRGANEDGSPAPFGSKNVLTGTEEFRQKFPAFANTTISNMALDIDNGDSQKAVSQRLDLINFTNETFLGDPVKQRAYQSCVEVYLDFGQNNGGAVNYTKRLDMRDAVVTVEYDYDGAHYTRETFASYPDQAVVTNVKSEGKSLDFTAELHTWLTGPKSFEKISDNELKIVASPADLSEKNGLGHQSKIKAEARMYIVGDGASLNVSEDHSTIHIKGGNEATIYVVAATNYVDYLTLDDTKPGVDCERYMSKIKNKDYSQIRLGHEYDYKELFDRASLTLDNNNNIDKGNTPTEQRIRKNLSSGASGYSIGSGNSLSASTPVNTTYNDGDNKLVSMLFNYGRYLTIAGSRDADEENGIPMSQPLNLTGKWNSSTSPSWAGKYTININTEMNYWPSQPLNLSECIMPLREMLFDLAENGSITAKYQYGIGNHRNDDEYLPGDPWVMHNNTDLWRGTQFVDNAGVLWPMGGAWLMDCVWKYYQYNLDTDYIAELYPIMRGLSDFYTQFLMIDPKTGYLITAASSSPEQGSIQPGSAIDTQLIRNLYDMTIKSAEMLGKTAEDEALIADMKAQLPTAGYFADEAGKIAPNRIDKSGLIMEWVRGDVQFDFSKADESNKQWTYTDPFNGTTLMYRKHAASNTSGHRHTSHLWELFPGTHLNAYSKDSGEKAIYTAFQKALLARGAGSGQGWGLAWRIGLSAKAHDGQTADARLEQLIRLRMSPNLFDQHPHFQIDGNYGAAAGITEMVMQNQGDTIEIIPALSSKWKSGEFKGFKAIGNIEVGAKWTDGAATSINVKPAQDRELKIRCASFDADSIVADENHHVVNYNTEDDGTVIIFAGEAGKTYTIYSAKEEVTWVKDGSMVKDWVKNSTGESGPKYYSDNLYMGAFFNDGTPTGFSMADCELDNLTKLGIKIGVYPYAVDHGTVTVRLGTVTGPVIGSVVMQATGGHKSFVWLDIPLNKDIDNLLVGKQKLYFLVQTDVARVNPDTKYICNIEAVSGTRSIQADDNDIIKVKFNGKNYANKALLSGTYTITVADAECSEITDAKLIIGLYENDDIKEYQMFDITNDTRSGDFTVDSVTDGSELKIMIWDDMNNIQPLEIMKTYKN